MGKRLTTGEVCTRNVTTSLANISVYAAARLMRANQVGCLAVVDEVAGQRFPVGILTDRDILSAVVAENLDPACVQVGEIMSTDLITARENDSLTDLMRTLRRKGVRRAPVVGEQGELLGMVTLDDVLSVLAEELGLLVMAIPLIVTNDSKIVTGRSGESDRRRGPVKHSAI